MVSSIALLSAVLSLLPPPAPGVAAPHGALPWVSATALAARLHSDHQLQAEPVLGVQDGRPVALAVVPLDPSGHVRAEVRTALAFLAMAAAARACGVELQVSSGFRTHEEQTELFRLYRMGKGPLASRPGTSNHQSGHALDIETRALPVRLWLRRHAYRFGFLRTVPSERWHWEYW
jgi:hypothetical protein